MTAQQSGSTCILFVYLASAGGGKGDDPQDLPSGSAPDGRVRTMISHCTCLHTRTVLGRIHYITTEVT